MSNLNYFLMPISFSFKYNGLIINNESCGTSFIKGGVAREWAMKALGQPIEIKVRDLDLWIERDDTTSTLSHLYHQGEDGRQFSKHKDNITHLLNNRDVNINRVLLGKKGVYIDIDAYIGIKRKLIWRDCHKKAGKRAIRAHFFAMRYGYKVIDGSFIDPSHSYIFDAFKKALQLNLLDKWKDYLINRCLVKDFYLPNKKRVIWEYLYNYNSQINYNIKSIISFREMRWDDWDEYFYELPMGEAKEWVNNSLKLLVDKNGWETIIFVNKKNEKLFIQSDEEWILYD